MTLPSASDVEAWAEPAERREVATVAKFLVTACDGAEDPARVGMLARLVAMRDYTRAELALAVQRVPFDPRASHNYGRGLNAADVERVVAEHRKLRAMLDRVLTQRQMFDVCAEFHGDVSPSDFGVCGYDVSDRPFFRFAGEGAGLTHELRPQLPERATERNDEPIHPAFADLVARVTKRAAGDGQADGMPEVQS